MLCYYGDDMGEYGRLCSWEDTTKMVIKEIMFDGMSWMELAKNRAIRRAHRNDALNLRVV